MLYPKRVWGKNLLKFKLPLEKIDVPHRDAVTKHTCFLAPEVAERFNKLPEGVAVSDMWRSGKGSYMAILRGRPAARPGNSGHNWGLSIDLDLMQTFKNLDIKGTYYQRLDKLRSIMYDYGWHWIESSKGLEEWHFNGTGEEVNHNGFWSVYNWVNENWDLELTTEEYQGALKYASKLFDDTSLDPGEVDGRFGAKTQKATDNFALKCRLSSGHTITKALISVCSYCLD